MDNQFPNGYPQNPQQNDGTQVPQQPQYAPQPQAPQQPQYAPQPQAPQQPQYAPQPQAPQQPQYAPQPQAPQQPQYAPQPQAPQYPVAPAPQPKKKTGLIVAIIAVILVIAIGLTAAFVIYKGKGDSSDKDDKDGKPKSSQTTEAPKTLDAALPGTWTATLDFTDMIKKEVGSDQQALFDGVKFDLMFNFTFNDDGTYSLTLDEDAFSKTKSDMIDALVKNVIPILKSTEESLKDMSDEEVIAFYEQASGQKWDDFIAEFKEEMENELDAADLASDVNTSGKYKVDGDKLYLSEDVTTEPDESEYLVIKLNSNTSFSITEIHEDSVLEEEVTEMFKNAEFTKK